MSKIVFTEPLTCDQMRELMPKLVNGQLGVEQRGRMEGHILMCDECAVAFGEEIAKTIEQSGFDYIPAPPIKLPEIGRLSPAMEVKYVLNAAKFKLSEWEWIKNILEKQAQSLINKLRMTIMMMGNQALELATLDGSDELEETSLRIIDPLWQPTDEYVTFQVTQPPVITADGKFILAISTTDPKWNECIFICKMKLTLEDMITFETNIRQMSDNKWQAKIEADGLPAPQMDVSVPTDILELYLYSLNQ